MISRKHLGQQSVHVTMLPRGGALPGLAENKAQPSSGRLWYVAQTNSDLGPAVPRHLAAKFPGLCLLKKQARQENQGEFCRDRASCLRAYSSGDKAVDTLSLQIF